jgi:hypothetical protein
MRNWVRLSALLFRLPILLLILNLSAFEFCYGEPFPIQFGIPEDKIVKEIPVKDTDFAPLIPNKIETYIYHTESEYYNDYKRSFFAITCKKAGWDCMRHYEILANGCIPYFIGLDDCDLNNMYFLPRELIKEAMNLSGVKFLRIDHPNFDRAKYDEILKKMIEHTRKYLTTESIANYLLNKVHYSGKGKILYLSGQTGPDYMRETILIGLKQLYPENIIDYPKIDFLYKSYTGDISCLYGKGMTYTKNLDDVPVDRDNIDQRIAHREYELIIYGSIHRGLPYHDLVLQNYPPEKVVYVCGEDEHVCEFRHLPNLFLREWGLNKQ